MCPCPPWFPKNTVEGTYNWSLISPPKCNTEQDVPETKYYGTIIEYICPEGYFFDLPKDEYNDTDILILTCESWADWSPSIQPKCIRKYLDSGHTTSKHILHFKSHYS